MLQAERLDGPRQMIPEDLSDPSFLGAGEHGGRYRSRTASRGPARVSAPRTSRPSRHDSHEPGPAAPALVRELRNAVATPRTLPVPACKVPSRADRPNDEVESEANPGWHGHAGLG